MKKLLIALTAIFTALPVFAQNQGDPVPLGHGGQFGFCQVNESGTATASEGQLNYPACDTAGRPLGGSALIAMTPVPYVAMLPTAIPTAFGTPQFAANATGLKSLTVDNSYDIDVVCAYGGSITPSFVVHGGSQYYDNYAANGQKMAAAVGCARLGATPVSGQLTIWGDK